jgi:hypothetical protein
MPGGRSAERLPTGCLILFDDCAFYWTEARKFSAPLYLHHKAMMDRIMHVFQAGVFRKNPRANTKFSGRNIEIRPAGIGPRWRSKEGRGAGVEKRPADNGDAGRGVGFCPLRSDARATGNERRGGCIDAPPASHLPRLRAVKDVFPVSASPTEFGGRNRIPRYVENSRHRSGRSFAAGTTPKIL